MLSASQTEDCPHVFCFVKSDSGWILFDETVFGLLCHTKTCQRRYTIQIVNSQWKITQPKKSLTLPNNSQVSQKNSQISQKNSQLSQKNSQLSQKNSTILKKLSD